MAGVRLAFVALPCHDGWHYIERSQILGVQAAGEKQCRVLLAAGLALDVSEDSSAVHRRIEPAPQAKSAEPAPTPNADGKPRSPYPGGGGQRLGAARAHGFQGSPRPAW